MHDPLDAKKIEAARASARRMLALLGEDVLRDGVTIDADPVRAEARACGLNATSKRCRRTCSRFSTS